MPRRYTLTVAHKYQSHVLDVTMMELRSFDTGRNLWFRETDNSLDNLRYTDIRQHNLFYS